MPTKEIKTFCAIGRVEPLESIDIETETIDVSDLEEYKCHNFDGSISFEVDKKTAQELYKTLQPKHGEKLTAEASCVCDGTLIFAVQLMQALARMGATNIKIRSEEVENPNPAWMKTRFIATGIIWNTNNFRKLHGIPMKRRNHGKSKA